MPDAPLINFDDNLSEGQHVDGVIYLVGFAQTPGSTGSVKIYVDGVHVGTATYPTYREDVPNSGFTFFLNTEGLPEGPKIITARSFDANGQQIASVDRNLVVDREDPIAEIESPDHFGAGLHTVEGWALAENGFRQLEVLVNGRLTDVATYGGNPRPDVAALYPEYGIVNSGFEASLDTSGLPQGWNTLTLVGIAQDGTRRELASQQIHVDLGVQAIGVVDTSTTRMNSSGQGLTISGWAAAGQQPVRVEVVLDDRVVGRDTAFDARADVAAAHPQYAWTGGWSIHLPDDVLSAGAHDLRVVATFADGKKVNLDHGQTGVRDLFIGYAGHDVSVHLVPKNNYAASVDAFEAATSLDLDGVLYFQDFDMATFNAWPFLPQQLVDSGVTPIISWVSHNYTSAQIAAGEVDGIITNFAQQIRDFGHDIVLRVNHEFNGDYYKWSGPQSNNSPETYVAAWRRIVELFEAAGAENVLFMWSPNYASPPNVPAPSNDFRNYYPGDGYVDLIGVSGYNWGNDPTNGTGWVSPAALFDIFMQQIRSIAPDKPVVISEIGSSPDYDGHDAAQWIREAFATMDNYLQVRDVIWFNDRAFNLADGMDFRVAADNADYGPVAADTTAAFTEAASRWDQVGDIVAYRHGIGAYTFSAYGVAGVTVTGDHGAEPLAAPERLFFSDASVRVIRGTATGNVLTGGEGLDMLIGGAGNDTYVTDGADIIVEAQNGGADLVQSTGTTVLGANLERLTLMGVLPIDGTGNALTNTIIGNAAANVLSGADGADVLSGGLGDDTLVGGLGDDTLNGGGNSDTASYVGAVSGVVANLAGAAPQVTGGAGNDTLLSVENVSGSGFNDVLSGDGAANVLQGQSGDDRLNGRGGDDRLDGGGGVDTADYADAASRVVVNLTLSVPQNTFGSGVDTLTGLENVVGSAYADTLIGDAGHNALTGGLGNDVLEGGLGNDTLDGGVGVDTASYAGATTGVDVAIVTVARNTVGAGVDRLISIENLTGSDFDDRLQGDGGANALIGGDGDDLLRGGLGDDIIGGGTGSDTLVGGLGNDALNGGTGADTAQYSDAQGAVTVDLRITVAQNTVGGGSDTLVQIENVSGSSGDDLLTGNDGANVLRGEAGVDVLDGGGGGDTLIGGLGNDQLAGGLGADKLYGGLGNDQLDGGADADMLRGEDGDDTLIGAGEDDTAIGGAGVDTVSGGLGSDKLYGDAGGDQLDGGDGADLIYGGAENDVLIGGADNDRLYGDAGDDRLTGGTGADSLYGSTGADVFVFFTKSDSGASVAARDVVRDFSRSDRDKIDLSGIDAIDGAGDDAFTLVTTFTNVAGQLVAKLVGSYTLVEGDTNGDGLADFSISVLGGTAMVTTDFVL